MNKFEETVNELKADIDELEESFTAKTIEIDESKKAQARELVDKAKKAINTSIEKVSAVIEKLEDSEKLDDLLDKLKAKSKEAVDYTLDKIDALINNEPEISIDELHDEIMAEFENLKGNETIRKTTVLIKQGAAKINEFLEKPEVKDTINKAKKTTIKVAEKGVEGLKKVLEAKEETSEEEK